MLAKRTWGCWNSDWEAVAKSVRREPTVRTRSASRARSLVAGVPSRPIPPSCEQPRHRLDLLGVGGGAADGPGALGEQLGRVVVGVGLDVLGQGQDHGAGVDRIG